MSKKANKTLIGVFVVAAVIMLVAAVIIFGSGKFFQKSNLFVAYFSGSVKGLAVGAPVMFRGVQIGQVTGISLRFYEKTITFNIPVMITLYPENVIGIEAESSLKDRTRLWDKLLQDGLRAQLQLQSLVTGQLFVQLDFQPNAPLKLHGIKDLNLGPDVREIPTVESQLQALGKQIEQIPLDQIAADLNASIAGINKLVNSPELKGSLQYFNQTLQEARDLIHHVDQNVDPLFAKVDQSLAAAQTVLQDIGQQIGPLSTSFKNTSDAAGKLFSNVNSRVGPVQEDLQKTTAQLRSAISSAESAVIEIDGMVAEGSDLRYYIDNFLREITMAARSVRALADYLERNPDALLRGRVDREQKKGR